MPIGGGPAGAAATNEDAAGFRPDVEGLRGVAVALVVAFHLGVSRVYGGWVGVDVFFVISGFVITASLLRRRETTGTISLRRFYAARVRRLLPSSALVLLAVVVALAWRDGALARQWAGEARAAALYLANVHLASQGVVYAAPVSPFQHYWSLALEEQFYLVWPALLLVVLRGARRPRSRALVLVGAAGAASFTSLVVSSGDRPLDAFYLLPNRAWELSLGAGVAVLVPHLRRLPHVVAAVMSWCGVALVAYAAHEFLRPDADALRHLPVPALGAALIIGAGVRPSAWGASRVLAWRPLMLLGRLSYAIYLWHLPVIVFGSDGGPVSTGRAAILVLVTVALAVASHVLVERPIRWHPWLVRRPGWSLAGALVVTVVVLVAAGFVTRARPLTSDRAAGDRLANDATEFVPSDLHPALDAAAAMVPAEARARPCLVPVMRGDDPDRGFDCALGDPSAARTVVLLGDSHAWHWWPALDEIARSQRWRLVLAWKPCRTAWYSPGPAWERDHPEDADCAAWRARTFERLRAAPPDLVVLGAMDDNVEVLGTDGRAAAAAESARRLPRVPLVIIGDTPHLELSAWGGPLACLAKHLDNVRPCDFTWPTPVAETTSAHVRAAAARAGARLVDPQPWVCPTTRCALIRGNTLVFRDTTHLTEDFARSLAPKLGPALVAAMG